MSEPTPMMARYLEVKAEHPGTLLLFRMGDFYELFYEDAELAAKRLGITLTSRDKSSSNPVPMAGFPHHALRNHLSKLIRAGHRVAVCEQMEDPATAKGMVRREVTQVVTPGTLTDDDLLDANRSNFLAALHRPKGRGKKGGPVGLAWLDVSTGRFVAADLDPNDLPDELARIAPSELLLAEGTEVPEAAERIGSLLTERPAYAFGTHAAIKRLTEHFGTSTLAGFDLDDAGPGVAAAAALLEYAADTQKAALPHITGLSPYHCDDCLRIDEATRRSLELTRTLRDGSRAGSLLDVLDDTKSPMGARRLADWLAEPLTNAEAITARHDAVEDLHDSPADRQTLREALAGVYDLERLAGRVATRRASPRDLAGLCRTLGLLPKIKDLLHARHAERLTALNESLDPCPAVREDVAAALTDDPPVQVTEGNLIRSGFSPELDELRALAKGGKEWIASYRAEEAERTGISSLKVGFNKVFGYYLEVTTTHKDKVPEDYTRKQTLKDRERYITPALKEYEDKVLRAEERAVSLEQELFTALRERVAEAVPALQRSAGALAELDVLACFAHLAATRRYVRPELSDEPVLSITAGRHPVLDVLRPGGEFVPNDTTLSPEDRVHLITGPNMAGKSTYIRQTALILVLAQCGSFVPADAATIGLADRVFARVGAGDDLGRGQSTFMVEMTETARILNAATEQSLVILDEIGRGTSTYDGLSLAWAVTEHLHDGVQARTLFATHYHELTGLDKELAGLSNRHVAVAERDGTIVFLHTIRTGPASQSYGIHVAKLAGVPRPVLERAAEVLRGLEEGAAPTTNGHRNGRSREKQIALFQMEPEPHPALERLKGLDPDHLTPMEALRTLAELRASAH
ncbi:DNA mismatch repair protein MutS [Alienimonas chondri]|uniref:DNA mismatch repair protein MutS n=1 Tax=Alienimonas chondri TaxID=2681879 RepID=A0ABX1VF96_9PLAN|nr:DNA mismatch repair protein MutS [Alienimonas chondri]NNJ26419.1 DNA mismatch repair protein MutS [Alienimonas chondri]